MYTSNLKIDELRFIAEYKNIKIQNYKIMKICKKVDWILELEYFNQHPLGWVREGVGVGEHSHKFNNFNVLNTKSSFQQLFINYVYFNSMEYLTIVMCLVVHSSESFSQSYFGLFLKIKIQCYSNSKNLCS